MSWLSEWLHKVINRPRPRPPVPPKPVPPVPVPPVPTDDRVVALVAAINAARRDNGLAPLIPDGRLMGVAQAHAEDNASRGVMTHSWASGGSTFDHISAAGYPFSNAGECIAQGQRTAEQVVDAWLSDRPHRVIVLGVFRDVGCGWAEGYWVAVFGSPA